MCFVHDTYMHAFKTPMCFLLNLDSFVQHAHVYELNMQNENMTNIHNRFFAGYDAPFKITDRHNEIWIKLE